MFLSAIPVSYPGRYNYVMYVNFQFQIPIPSNLSPITLKTYLYTPLVVVTWHVASFRMELAYQAILKLPCFLIFL